MEAIGFDKTEFLEEPHLTIVLLFFSLLLYVFIKSFGIRAFY